MEENTRVTLVLPKALWENVKELAPAGQRSKLVTEALNAEVRRRRRFEQLERIKNFQAYMREKYGESPSSADEINQMRAEHDDELTSVH